MRLFASWFISAVLVFIIAGSAMAQSSDTHLTLTPSAAVFARSNVVGVPHDGAPGFEGGSFRTNGLVKGEMYFAPELLFAGRQVLVGDVAQISYWTKNGTTHVVNPYDWYLVVYTKRYAGQSGTGWYGTRLGAEPYYSVNLVDPANKWVKWSIDSAKNQLRWFESTYNNFGAYTDPSWEVFATGTSLPGVRGTGVPYASQPILYFSVQTASGVDGVGYTGKVDGLTIRLKDGSVATVNLEAVIHRDDDRSDDHHGKDDK